jgi:hypothetical protein
MENFVKDAVDLHFFSWQIISWRNAVTADGQVIPEERSKLLIASDLFELY